jgi:polyphosphate kinase
MDKKLYFNRELSWLSFNYRVLQEANDPSVPLYERIKFLAIFSSNLDEFFRVRVASLRSLFNLKWKTRAKLKFEPAELLKRIHSTVNKQQREFGEIIRKEIIPQLNLHNVFLIDDTSASDAQKIFAQEYFNENVLPHIQPVLIVNKKFTLFLNNRSIYLAVRLLPVSKKKVLDKNQTGTKRFKYAMLEIPSEKLPRFIRFPSDDDNYFVMFLDDLIRINLQLIFPGYSVSESYSVKLTRDAELYIDDEFTGNLLQKIKKSLSKRKTGAPSRFLYDEKMPKEFLTILRQTLGLKKEDLIPGGRYHNYHDFFSFPNPGIKELEYPEMLPLKCPELETGESIFQIITQRDVLIHYPYHSFEYVIKFLEEAAADDQTESIKITLYRTGTKSRIIKALCSAAASGKKVTAFVEVKARFDEELNFVNAEELEHAGVKVLYSFPGLKVHSKICLISRIEDGNKKYYAYLSTGNFNEKTAKIYSDIGLFTSNNSIIDELRLIFNFLSKKTYKVKFKNTFTAPFNLRSGLSSLIDNEILAAREGKKASIILKLNSLEDRKIIKKLYEASTFFPRLHLEKNLKEKSQITNYKSQIIINDQIFKF